MIHKNKPNKKVEKGFHFDNEEYPSVNIINLLDAFQLKGNIEFFTTTNFKPASLDKALSKKYKVESVQINGTMSYVKYKFNKAFNLIRKSLEDYFGSSESVINKIYELSKTKVFIQEFLLFNNSYDPVLLNMSSTVMLCNADGDRYFKVRWEQCILTEEVKQEIIDHIYLRNTYANQISDLCSLQIEKLYLHALKIDDSVFKNDLKRETQLLQVWVGLNLTGFLEHLNADQKSIHRKKFFELFQLNDRHYNDRNNVLKRTKEPKKTNQLVDMIEKIRNYV